MKKRKNIYAKSNKNSNIFNDNNKKYTYDLKKIITALKYQNIEIDLEYRKKLEEMIKKAINKLFSIFSTYPHYVDNAVHLSCIFDIVTQ